jgi:hypothetical protein
MGKTLDTIVIDTLGLKEMTICRLLWEIDDLKSQIEELKQALTEPPKD